MTVNNIDFDDIDFELLMSQSKLLYPEVHEWILEMSVEAYINELKKQNETED